MSDLTLATYAHQFKKLRRDHKFGGAPHKPILLLAVAHLVLKGEIIDRRVRITPQLVLAFKSYWSKLVITPHQPNFALPFFHMRSEPFWELIPFPGMQVAVTSSASVKSLSNMKQTIAFAQIDEALFDLFSNAVMNAALQRLLLETYFPETKAAVQTDPVKEMESELSSQMVNEPSPVYRQRIEELEQTLSISEIEEEIFIRSGIFKREIPKLYDYRCAISGLRVTALSNVQLVDACHIVPFALSKDDTITNGICLTPTLHRAFDRGLIGISEDYEVFISSSLVENDSPYNVSQFAGKRISLPESVAYYPSVEGLKWHKQNCFFNR